MLHKTKAQRSRVAPAAPAQPRVRSNRVGNGELRGEGTVTHRHSRIPMGLRFLNAMDDGQPELETMLQILKKAVHDKCLKLRQHLR